MAEDNSLQTPLIGVSLNIEIDFLKCLLPLFEQGQIDALEWSFDTMSDDANEPIWFTQLLKEYAKENRLLGHGVFFSLMDAKWTQKQELWIKQLSNAIEKYNYHHITEHFGFMSSGDFHKGCPLPVPLNKTTLKIGVDRLIRIQELAKIPVGIENLAFAFSMDDVSYQGEFLEKLISPINGFIILDLHNIYCQSHNFKIEMMQLINLYPLELVKEIHISGGSWEHAVYGNEQIRRDTHDDNVPKVIFDILPAVLQKCSATEFIIFERLGNTFQTDNDVHEYHKDFNKLKEIVCNLGVKFKPKNWGNTEVSSGPPINDSSLYDEQNKLCNELLNARTYKDIKDNFKNWDISSWNPEMIETAIKMSKKWN